MQTATKWWWGGRGGDDNLPLPFSATVFLHLHVNFTYCVVSLVDISITTSAGPGRYIFFPTPVNKIRCGFVKLTSLYMSVWHHNQLALEYFEQSWDVQLH